MTQTYNMKGILRGFNFDPSNGMPEGFSIENVKDGKPSGYVKFHAFNELGEHAAGIREALKTLKKDDPIDYQSQDYKPIKIGAPGTVYGNGNKGNGGYGRMSPEDRRSIERQKALDVTARVFESLIAKSETKVQKTFSEIMDEIRAEAAKTAAWIHQEGR